MSSSRIRHMKFLGAILLWPALLFAWANPGTFNPFVKRYFVETGSFVGDGIEEALRAGFAEIRSVTLEEAQYIYCQERFKDHPNVHLYHGDSGRVLEEMIRSIDEPVTFWLDAHNDGDVLPQGTNTPILRELDAIRRHPIKTHTILIDDVRLFNTAQFDWITLATIIRKIYEINPQYRITYLDGFVKRDILVAYIPVPLQRP